MNRNHFQKAAKLFRAGRLSLDEFTSQVLEQAGSTAQTKPDAQSTRESPPTELLNLFQRNPDSHKGDFGRCLMVGGSRTMPGAISLCGMAALRAGAGLVKIATSVSARPIVAAFDPSLMTFELPEGSDGLVDDGATIDAADFEWADCIAVGPGLGSSAATQKLVQSIVDSFEGHLVIDADGLNSLAPITPTYRPKQTSVLTPHPGEFAKLFPGSKANDRQQMISVANEKATKLNAVIVLKGHQTWVTNGEHHFLNSTGNPGMATAGAGDVLTGIIAALIGQRLAPFEAARWAVRIHGIAGDLAAAELGQISVTAADLLDYLPDAFEHLRANPD